MKKITSDVYDITNRIKLIDSDYELYIDENTNNYLVFACGQYCLNLGKVLDATALEKLLASRVENCDKIFSDIELHNNTLENNIQQDRQTESKYKLQQIYKYANSHTEDIDYNNIFKTNWV